MVAILTDEQVKLLQNDISKEEYNQLHEGASPARDEAFSVEVYQRRLWKIQGKMKENSINVALLVSPEAQCWLHGYQARWYRAETSTEWPPCNFTAVCADFVGVHSPISDGTQLNEADRKKLEENWKRSILIFDSSDHEKLLELTSSVPKGQFKYFDLPTADANPDDADTSLKGVCGFVLDTLKKEGWIELQSSEGETKILGLELCSHRQNVAVTDSFREAIGSYKIKIKEGTEEGDREIYISGMLRSLQTIKEPAELKWIRDAGKILDDAYLHLKHGSLRWKKTGTDLPINEVGLNPEMTELQVWAEMEWAMAQSGGESAGLHNTVSKGRTYCHALSSTRRIGNGALLLDPSGVKHRYHANTARTFYVGEEAPPLALIKASLIAGGAIDILKEKCQAMLTSNQEGWGPEMTFGDLNKELLKYYKSFEIKDDNTVPLPTIWDRRDWIGGYQLGISFPPDWVGEFSWNVVTAEAADKPQSFEHLKVEDDKKMVPGLVTNFESFIGGYGFIDTIIFGPYDIEVVSKMSQTLYLVHLERNTTYADVENYQEFAKTYSSLGRARS